MDGVCVDSTSTLRLLYDRLSHSQCGLDECGLHAAYFHRFNRTHMITLDPIASESSWTWTTTTTV